jgi:hypothetical protein
MRDGRRAEQPSELVYVPGPSWAPVLAAVGLALVGIALFTDRFYFILGVVAGGLLILGALLTWIRGVSRDIGRLPREQRISTAVLPAVPLRSGDDDA